MDYSVLMTIYKKDSPEYFIQSVESMLNQTVKTNDFVLVCDGELTDELEKAIVLAFKGHESILNLVRLEKNVGLGQALNIGLPLCKNEWVARMDDDDVSHLNRCELQLKYIEQHPDLTILGSYVNEFEDDPRKPIRVKTVPTEYSEILKFSRRRNPFNHSTVMLNKEKTIGAGNYSVIRTNQDVSTWVRLLNSGCKGANLPEALVDFRFDANTYERRKDLKNISLMIKVWWSFYQKKYCSLLDFMYVFLIQVYFLIMPKSAIIWAYNHKR